MGVVKVFDGTGWQLHPFEERAKELNKALNRVFVGLITINVLLIVCIALLIWRVA